MTRPIFNSLFDFAGFRWVNFCTLGLFAFALLGQLAAHTTYLRPVDYQPDPGDPLDILIYHGTFDESAQSVDVEFIEDLKGHGPSGSYPINRESWTSREPGSKTWQKWNAFKHRLGGMNLRRTSTLEWSSEEPGFHMIGVEVKPSRIAMDREKFHEYLVEVGLENEPISEFRPDNTEGIFTEIFIKTAKTVVQIGKTRDGTVTEPIGLSSELVPLQNPMDIRVGESISFQLLLRGSPLADQVVLAGQPHGFAGKGRGAHSSYRSDSKGIVTIPFPEDGEWWVAFDNIRIAPADREYDLLTHWTTLTFEIDP